MTSPDSVRPEIIDLTDDDKQVVAREARRRRLRCDGCGNNRFGVGGALYLGFLFVGEEHDAFIVALTCTNPACPTPHAGITVRGPKLRKPKSKKEHPIPPLKFQGRKVVDTSDEPLGHIEEVYVDAVDGVATWALIRTGMLRTKKRFAPLFAASMGHGHVVLPIEGSLVRHTPPVAASEELPPASEEKLLEHYHLGPVLDRDERRPAQRYAG